MSDVQDLPLQDELPLPVCMKEAIAWCRARDLQYAVHGQWHMKIGHVNWYPSQGTVFRTGAQGKLPQRGYAILEEVLREDGLL